MKTVLILVVAMIGTSAFADQLVSGHFRKNGTYVQPYYRTAPNNTKFDNYSTQGNINPYTGNEGSVNPYNQNLNTFNSQGYYGY